MLECHEELLEKWACRPHHSKKTFIKDGIIDNTRWFNAKRKVLFMLKEAYGDKDSEESYDLRAKIREEWRGPKYNLWWNVSYWSYAIERLGNGKIPPFPDYDHFDTKVKNALLSSAIVNIKKSRGSSSSFSEDIYFYVKKDGDLIRRQVELINPNIIVCGNVWDQSKQIWPEAKKCSDMIFSIGKFKFVDYWHPANRFPHKINYYALCSIIHISGIFS